MCSHGHPQSIHFKKAPQTIIQQKKILIRGINKIIHYMFHHPLGTIDEDDILGFLREVLHIYLGY